MKISRRGLLGGLLGVVAAPAIVRVENLMVLPAKIFLPDPIAIDATFTHNNMLTIQQITCESVRLFSNSNTFLLSLKEPKWLRSRTTFSKG